jgi:hypothetical protein
MDRKFRKMERLLMISSYLANICPFHALVTRNIKEELHQTRFMVGQSNMAAIGFTYAQQMPYPVLIISDL